MGCGRAGNCYFRDDDWWPTELGTECNHTAGRRPGLPPAPTPPGPSGTCSAGEGAGTYIHLLSPHVAPGVGARGCCAACGPPPCTAWGFGYRNGTECWLSPNAPVSTMKRAGFSGGVVKRPPPPPPPPPAPTPPPPKPEPPLGYQPNIVVRSSTHPHRPHRRHCRRRRRDRTPPAAAAARCHTLQVLVTPPPGLLSRGGVLWCSHGKYGIAHHARPAWHCSSS